MTLDYRKWPSRKTVAFLFFATAGLVFLLTNNSVLAQPQAQISVFKTSGLAPFTVLFNAKNSSGNIVRYEWNFNDSNSDYPSTDEGRMVGHRFDNPGSYNVQLTVYEENGSSAQAQITITALSQPAGAKTYYISTSGNSANDGLSESLPWDFATLQNQAATLPDGSKVLFKRGDNFDTSAAWQFYDLLRPHPNYLTLGAYGSGAKPKFGTISTGAKYEDKGIIIENLQVTSLKIRPQYYQQSLPVGFHYPGHQVTVRNLTVGNGDIFIWQSEGVSIENTTIDRDCDTGTCPDGEGIGVSSDSPGTGYLYVNKIDISGVKNHCIYLAGWSHDVLVENSNLHHCGIYGINRDGFTVHGKVDNLIIRNNEIHDNYFASGLDSAYDKGTPPEYIRNVIFENNKIYNQESYVFQLRSLQNSIFRNNLIYNNPGIVFGIYGPKIDDGQLDEPTTNIEIYNNTIYSNTNGVVLYLGRYETPNHNEMISNIYFKNNIVVSSSGRVLTSYLPDLNRVFMSNNIYSGALVKPAIDPNSFNLDPLLVNPAGNDFTLQDSSPVINAGAILKVKYDYASNLRDTAPDIGAYENLSVPPPCVENWSCGSWSTCANSSQSRTCTDANSCGTTVNKPTTIQACTATCSPNWICSSWSTCVNNSQTRSCADGNQCGLTSGKPTESQSCSAASAPIGGAPTTPTPVAPTPTNTNTASSQTSSIIEGSLVKTEKFSAVYLFENNQKRYIPTESIFLANGFFWNKIQTVDQNILKNYAVGTDLTYPNNTLLKAQKNSAVYLFGDGKRKVFFNAKYFLVNNYRWEKIFTTEQSYLNQFGLSANIVYSDGTLIKGGDANVYLLENGKRRAIASGALFEQLGLRWHNIIVVSDFELTFYPEGAKITAANDIGGTFIRSMDLDGDGLDNALEKIYGSDPNKIDTDGDGFLDGAEVENGFSPIRRFSR